MDKIRINLLPGLVFIFLALAVFLIGIRLYCTNIDEVYFADPVINYLSGRGYVSTAWNVIKSAETHVSTAPVYSFLLLLWLKVFGISQFGVRALSACMVLAVAIIFWRTCLRLGLIKSGMSGSLLMSLIVLDYGNTFSYSVGRPDLFSALIVVSLFYFYTLGNRTLAMLLIFVVSMLIPFVQWGCVIYIFWLSIALILIIGLKILPHWLIVGFGMAVGLAFQKLIYTYFGIWEIWIRMVRSEGSTDIISRVIERLKPDTFLHHNTNVLPKDFSMLLVLVGMALFYLLCKFNKEQKNFVFPKAALVVAFTITCGIYLTGKFPTYYSWMLCLPLAAIIAASYDACTKFAAGKIFLIAVAMAGCIAGLPLQTALASFDWNDRQPANINVWLKSKVDSSDVVFCDYPFYFALKGRVRKLYVGRYFVELSPEELAGITVAVIGSPSNWIKEIHPLNNLEIVGEWRPAKSGRLGNHWEYGILSAPNFSCNIYKSELAHSYNTKSSEDFFGSNYP